ncbi:DUF5677 domain-containing protein [Roseibacterium beibuensis]|uniref:DUF5677 domain-containing protein n=1 Tax=[Roseibacterium] beibuensis TaxID=1193142 RepID=UPI00217ED28B|nr:DUF5677 domain-containing protein [Roseibacterium beibuensis]MCS6621569.1 DUF5677 domain-containing protein [Roseibacterium beibuensis]
MVRSTVLLDELQAYGSGLEKSESFVFRCSSEIIPTRSYPEISKSLHRYSFFLPYAMERSNTFFELIRHSKIIDAQIVARSILDSLAKTWICCIGNATEDEEIEKELRRLFYFEFRRNRSKFEAVDRNASLFGKESSLSKISHTEKAFGEKLSSGSSSRTKNFFEFSRIAGRAEKFLEPFNIKLPTDEFKFSYNLLSSFVHGSGAALFEFNQNIEELVAYGHVTDRLNATGTIFSVVAAWYYTHAIYHLSVYGQRGNFSELHSSFKEIYDLLLPIADRQTREFSKTMQGL